MFLGLLDPDPDPLVRCTDPAPDPSIVKRKKNLDSYCFGISFEFFSLKNDVSVLSKSNKQKNFFLN